MRKILLKTDVEVFPLLIHEEVHNGTQIEFKGSSVEFQDTETTSFFANVIAPLVAQEVLDSLEYQVVDASDADWLSKHGLNVNAGDTLHKRHLTSLKHLVKTLEINIARNGYGGFYIYAWVLDPFNRVWQVSPGEYVEGYHHIDIGGGFEEIGVEYARLNNLDISSLCR